MDIHLKFAVEVEFPTRREKEAIKTWILNSQNMDNVSWCISVKPVVKIVSQAEEESFELNSDSQLNLATIMIRENQIQWFIFKKRKKKVLVTQRP